MWTKFWNKMTNGGNNEAQNVAEAVSPPAPMPMSAASETYFTAEIHLIDGEILLVNAFRMSGGDTFTRYYRNENTYFFEIMDAQIKYTHYSDETIKPKSIEYGCQVMKTPKLSATVRRSRLKEVE